MCASGGGFALAKLFGLTEVEQIHYDFTVVRTCTTTAFFFKNKEVCFFFLLQTQADTHGSLQNALI